MKKQFPIIPTEFVKYRPVQPRVALRDTRPRLFRLGLGHNGSVAGPTMMWFRRDLRLSDNPALLHAIGQGLPVVGVFVLDDQLWGPAGASRRAFLLGCLRSLDDSMLGRLVIRRGPPEAVLVALARQVQARLVVAAEDFGPYGRARDERVARALAAEGCALERVASPYAVAPGLVLNREGRPYRVFTPFSRAWLDHGWPAPEPAPTDPPFVGGIEAGRLPSDPPVDVSLPEPGEAAAKRAARRYWDSGLASYQEVRNFPGRDATSRLSPYLRWGCLHPRQLLAKLGTGSSDRVFRSELCWREFYADVLYHDPGSARRAWNPAMATIEVDRGPSADRAFRAWAQGQTGYPLIDAGMRQLQAEGWMHNRVRMAVASFLVKDLHLDWTRGARHFMAYLVDGDVASNSHGWQWVAGTGTDASPYPRVFNPVTQSNASTPTATTYAATFRSFELCKPRAFTSPGACQRDRLRVIPCRSSITAPSAPRRWFDSVIAEPIR